MTKRIALGIETTGTHLGLALHDLAKAGAPPVARHFKAEPGKQSELLFPTLGRLLRSAKIRRADLAMIVVDEGPGSFTGVRVGVAAARGLAQSLGVPLIGVSALEALAWAAHPPEDGAAVVARLPALAGECYHAAYRRTAKGWAVLSRPAWTTDAVFEKMIGRLASEPLALVMVERAGAAAQAPPYRPPAGAAVHRVPAPDPSALVSLAVARHGARPAAARFPVERVVPVYLQPSWAERKPPPKKKRP